MAFAELLELNELARGMANSYPRRRALFSELAREPGKHFVGIVGGRGMGKTVLLRQLLGAMRHAFYISVDTLGDEDLFGVATRLSEELGVTHLLLDEVHAHPAFDEILKRIYDFLDVRIIFTSSVALAMQRTSHDLSRRVRLRTLPPFSFREYLAFTRDLTLPALSLGALFAGRLDAAHLRHAYAFEPYLAGGVLPFALEEPKPLELLRNVLEKTLQSDVPSVAPVRVDEIAVLRKLLEFVGRSKIDGINYTSVSQNLGVTKYKAESYLRLLEQAFVLHMTFPKGTNVLREPKITMALPFRLLYRPFDECIGELREDFFVTALRALGVEMHYLKSTRGAKTPDYLVPFEGRSVACEVGGKGKGRSQFKGIEADAKLVFSHDDRLDEVRRPLFSIGLVDALEVG